MSNNKTASITTLSWAIRNVYLRQCFLLPFFHILAIVYILMNNCCSTDIIRMAEINITCCTHICVPPYHIINIGRMHLLFFFFPIWLPRSSFVFFRMDDCYFITESTLHIYCNYFVVYVEKKEEKNGDLGLFKFKWVANASPTILLCGIACGDDCAGFIA